MAADPIKNVQEHVQDTDKADPFWHIFHELFGGVQFKLLEIPITENYTFVLTKFMFLELVAAGLIIAIFVPIARRAAAGGPPVGVWWNMFESLLTFIRDEIARPTLGGHDEHHHEEAPGVGPFVAAQDQIESHPPPAHHSHAASAAHALGNHHPLEKHEHPADKYVPFLWTVFLFILFCNLLGMIPFMGSPTASIWVTGAL